MLLFFNVNYTFLLYDVIQMIKLFISVLTSSMNFLVRSLILVQTGLTKIFAI